MYPVACFNVRALAASALAGLLLTGCASVTPPSEIPAAMQRHAAKTHAPAPRSAPQRLWWQALNDPNLSELVSEAESRNHGVKAMLASVKAARAVADGARRDALPQGSLGAQAQIQRPSQIEVDPYDQGLPRPPQQRIATISQGLSWEIDLFGRVGTAAAIEDRQADAAQADLQAAMMLLHAEVVQHYVQLRRDQQALRIITEELQLTELRLAQLNAREKAGLLDRREVFAAERDKAQRLAEQAMVSASESAHRAALAVLCGRAPDTQDAGWLARVAPADMPPLPTELALTQPADLLARRPDVARADAQLRAQLGQTVLAERAHWPRLSLNLNAGLNAPFGQLGQANAFRYALGPALQWDWLDAGRIKARETAAKAGAEAAWHHFEQTVLKALEESGTALSQWRSAQLALAQAGQSRQLAEKSEKYAASRVKAGLEPPVSALEHSLQSLDARRSELDARQDSLLAFGKVQLAIGAWQSNPVRP